MSIFGGGTHHTGEARAEAGSFANSGTVYGDVRIEYNQPPTARSRYLLRVAEIGPQDELIGRSSELRLMREFCLAGSVPSPYLRWRAKAWAGKTALMSWFTLNPPPGVRVVSFFVTSRLAGQSTWIAFTEVVIEQLAEILQRPMPVLTEATRYASFLGLLSDAARHCESLGERLVLVVDGLDEDRGVTGAGEGQSISGLLPAHPPAGMRIIVSGRPNPPIPLDVSEHHPLRKGASTNNLEVSPSAQFIKQSAESELQLLLAKKRSRELLGLLTAARGGLSTADLAELTGQPGWRVQNLLNSVSGRTYRSRTGQWGSDHGYLLAHENLQVAAENTLGRQLEDYEARIHVWAETYRRAQWPAGTSEYLLRGYFQLLRSTSDLPRMHACATDAWRHRRLVEASGDSSAALAEITTTFDRYLEQDDVDLQVTTRLALFRDRLAGSSDRVSATARLSTVAQSAAEGNMTDLGARLVRQAARVAHGIAEPWDRAVGLATVARAAFSNGEFHLARQLARNAGAAARESGSSAVSLVGALTNAARVASAVQDLDLARALVLEANGYAHAITDNPSQRVAALIEVCGPASTCGLREVLQDSGQEAAKGARLSPNPRVAALALIAIARAVGPSDLGRELVVDAGEVVRRVDDPLWQAALMTRLAEAAVATGNAGLANELVAQAAVAARELDGDANKVAALARVAEAATVAGDANLALEVVAEATVIAYKREEDPASKAAAMTRVAVAATSAGNVRLAHQLASEAVGAAGRISLSPAIALAYASRTAAIAGHAWLTDHSEAGISSANNAASVSGVGAMADPSPADFRTRVATAQRYSSALICVDLMAALAPQSMVLIGESLLDEPM